MLETHGGGGGVHPDPIACDLEKSRATPAFTVSLLSDHSSGFSFLVLVVFVFFRSVVYLPAGGLFERLERTIVTQSGLDVERIQSCVSDVFLRDNIPKKAGTGNYNVIIHRVLPTSNCNCEGGEETLFLLHDFCLGYFFGFLMVTIEDELFITVRLKGDKIHTHDISESSRRHQKGMWARPRTASACQPRTPHSTTA